MGEATSAEHQQLELDGSGTEEEVETSEKEKPSAEDELRAELARLREEQAVLRGQLSEATRAASAKTEPKEAPREFTRAELQAAVDRGDMDESRMEEILRRQDREQLRRELREDMAAEESARQTSALFDAYRADYPEIETPGSESYLRFNRRYQALQRQGLPDNIQTQLTALALEFGEAGKVQERRRKPESHQETAGGGGGSGAPPSGAEAWTKGLTPGQIDYQRKMLVQGYYSGTDDPRFKAYCERARKGKSRRAA